jgi:hypothetical protein
MRTDHSLLESIDRFQQIFWDKKSNGRPPVGVVNTDIYLPVKYLKMPFLRNSVEPSDVNPEFVQTDYEFAFSKRPVNIDDWIPFAAPWRAIPWLEAWCGCPVNFSNGSLAPNPIYDNIQALTLAPLPARDEWFFCLQEQIQHLVSNVPNDCWVSPTILRGCSDVISAIRGMEGFFYDLLEAPDKIEGIAGRINQLLIKALDLHFSLVKSKHAGYGHIFGYWSPEPTIVIQEDVIGLCNPSVYRDIFMQFNTQVVQHLGSYVLFHLHSTGLQHYRHVLDIHGLAGIQITIELNGPPLVKLLPVFREILEHSRLIIFADNRFNELVEILPKLPNEGLYVVVPETFIKSDSEYNEFISAIRWNKK